MLFAIGGLITSTMLTLLVVPIIYDITENFKLRMSRQNKHRDPSSGRGAAAVQG